MIFKNSNILNPIIDVLSADERVIFAYLYGSAAHGKEANDIDIAVFSTEDENPYVLSSDLKIALYKKTGLPPETFDIRILNGLIENADLFGLLYLKNILSDNQLLVDKSPDIRSHFLERYSFSYRECEGLFQEVLL